MPRIITALIFLLAAFTLGFFYTLPQWERLQALGDEIRALAQVSAEFDQLIANRDSLLERINSITKENLDRLDSMFPQGPHTSDLLVVLEALTVENSVALGRVDLASTDTSSQASGQTTGRSGAQPRPTAPASASPTAGQTPKQQAPGNGVQELAFIIQIAGSYDNFKKLLVSMEKNLRLMDVQDIVFNASGKADEALGITLKAKTYYQ